MNRDYSRILINDWIMPEEGATRLMTAADMNMAAMSAMEHTEDEHRAIIEESGLQIIFASDYGICERIIEAMVA